MFRTGQQDPLSQMDYRDAFNQTRVYEKHRSFLEKLGLRESLFQDDIKEQREEINQGILDDAYIRIEAQESVAFIGSFESSALWEKYRDECYKKVSKARRWAITKESRESISTLVLFSTIPLGAATALGTDSMGGGLAIFGALMNSIYFIREILGDMYTLYYTPSHPLDDLEKDFSTNQCFIPRELWPKISHNFTLARQNPYAQEANMQFIRFALGLRVFYPLADIVISPDDKEAALKGLSNRIDRFFESYNEFEEEIEFNKLKCTILKFLLALMGAEKPSRYLYLHGKGGIGKTYFANRLGGYINDIVKSHCAEESTYKNNDALHTANVIITTSEELEGSGTKPGALLKVLRDQFQSKKRGSIILMDEANWLNDKGIIPSAKRVFNGSLTRVSTDYLGSSIDGTAIGFEASPMLILLAGNDPIEDPALKSRFETILFPHPKQESLFTRGSDLLSRFPLCSQKKGESPFDLKSKLKDCINFREVESLVPALGTQYLYRKGSPSDYQEGMEEGKMDL